jgi:hypothetical protein
LTSQHVLQQINMTDSILIGTWAKEPPEIHRNSTSEFPISECRVHLASVELPEIHHKHRQHTLSTLQLNPHRPKKTTELLNDLDDLALGL